MRPSVVTIVGDMNDSDFLPNDLGQCQRLLLAAFKQATELEQRVTESERQVTELNRVLGETASSYEALQQEHAGRTGVVQALGVWATARTPPGRDGTEPFVRSGCGPAEQH